MQRPNFQEQIHGKIVQDLKNGIHNFAGGWQQSHPLNDRVARIMQLVSQLRLINTDVSVCLAIAQKWELRTFEETQNKEQYAEKMELKLNEIRQRRTQQASAIPLGAGGMMPNQMGNNGMMRPGSMMGGGMPNMQNMQNMGNMNGMNGMGFPNNAMGQQQNMMNGQNPMFPAQLARPMQPSPVNMPGQAGTLDPSALQMPPQARQQQQQQQQHQLQQPQQPQQNPINQTGQQQMANMGPGGQGQPGPLIAQRARQMYDKMPEEQRQAARSHLMASMPESQRQQLLQTKRDPLMQFCLKKAQLAFEEQRRQQMAGQQNAGMAGNGNNLNMQINGNNNNNNNGGQQPPSQGNGPNFDVSGILGQQANALKLQDAGEQVVPASNNNANNFNMGLGNQMNQSINPQMLGNQASMAGGNNAMNPQQAAFFNQQRNAQQQDRLQKQMLAQQHAMNTARLQQQQQNQLTGQPGGLHAPNTFAAGVGGQVPSPAMSMLNRPMVPPGQATPGTPQPNRQQPMGQLPMNGASQLLQHHQSMLNQNNHQQGQQGPQIHPQQLQAMLQRVPPEFREKLARMPPRDMQAMLMKMSAQRQQNNVNQPGQMNQPGMPPGMQQQNGPPAQNMLQQQMGNAVPGFNAQPTPNKQNMQMNNQAAVLQRNAQQQQLLRIRQQIMDSKPFPRQVLSMINISVPPQVQKWQELKQHVMQNGSVVPPQTLERVQQMQQQWYIANPQEVNSALQAYIAQQRRTQDQAQNGQQPQTNNAQQQPSAGNPQAPPAQMVPPAPMMQMPTPNATAAGDAPQQQIPPQMHAQVLRMITADDIQRFRATVGPRAQGMSDDQIRQFLANQRIEKWRSAQRAQQGQKPPAQTAQMPRPSQGNMSNISEAHQRTPQSGMPAGQKAPQPGSDDVVEIANPSMQQQAPQAPPMQPSHSQQRVPTKEQLAQMTPQQKTAWMHKRQQMEALRKAQGGTNGANSGMTGPQGDLVQKLNNMMKEVQQSTPKGPPINYDAQGQERVRGLLQRLWKPILQMSTTFPTALNWGLEQQLRDLIRTKLLLQQNAKDELGTMRDYYSVTIPQLQEMEKSIATYMTEFKSTQMRHQAQKNAGGKELPAHAPSMATAPSQQGHARKHSNMRAPPAPTDDKKFDWSAQSPGVPMYAQDQPGLTQDKLKFPPQKKRKPNQAGSQVSTPAAQVGTPATAGASPALANMKGQQSPEQARKAQQQLRAEAERAEREAEARKFRCKDSTCEHSLQGFDTEAHLEEHVKAQHQPVPNPLDFFLEKATTALELDGQGAPLPKPDVPATKVASSQAKPRLTVRDLKPEELTKQEMEQIKKNVISATVKQKLARKQAEADAASEKEKEAAKELTMRDAMCKKLDVSLAPVDPVAADANVPAEDTLDLDLSGYDAEGLDIFGMDANQMTLESIQEMASMGTNWEPVDGNLCSWRLRDDSDATNSSPELTPDGSQSSSSSDVRESDTMRFMLGVENDAWDAWGTGENLVAESMIPIYTQIKEMMADGANVNSNGDAEMKDSEGASPKKRKPVEDAWDVPVQDFLNNDFFGAQSGEEQN